MADLNVTTQEGAPRVLDFVFGAAIGIALSVGVMEVVKVAEFGQADLYGPGARLKITDTATAGIPGATLSASGFDETLHAQEFGQVDLYGPGARVKISDTAAAVLGGGPDDNATPSESLKIADVVTAALTPLFASGFDEVLFLEDGVLYEELLHLQDTVSAVLVQGPQNQELLHAQETITASLDGFQTSVGPDTLKLADLVTSQLTLIQASVAELIHVVDPVTVSRPVPRTLPLLYSSVTLYPVLWSWE